MANGEDVQRPQLARLRQDVATDYSLNRCMICRMFAIGVNATVDYMLTKYDQLDNPCVLLP